MILAGTEDGASDTNHIGSFGNSQRIIICHPFGKNGECRVVGKETLLHLLEEHTDGAELIAYLSFIESTLTP